jgi:glucose-1-phosphate adenylyltransferase
MMGADYYESSEELRTSAERGLPAVGVGRDCEVRNAIIDKNARIGDGVKLINSAGVRDRIGEDVCIVDGIIVVPKDAVLPSGTVV